MSDETDGAAWSGWAIVELFGHKRMAGFIGSQEVGGTTLIRIDVPATEPRENEPSYYGRKSTAAYSKFLGGGAIYGITPCTEDVARLAAREIECANDPLPVALPALRSPATVPESDPEMFDEDETTPPF